MKLRFFCYAVTSGNKLHTGLVRGSEFLDAGNAVAQQFGKYLLSSLHSDFEENRYGDIDATLTEIERLERGEIDSHETGGGGFVHYLTSDSVRFEHAIFGECPEWPIWYCTLAQYKAALQGYRRFLDMPKRIESELIVELPEGGPGAA